MFFVILALLEPGDEAIYPNPGFPIYESMINFTGAKAVPSPIREDERVRARRRRAGGADHAEDQAADHQQSRQPDQRRPHPRRHRADRRAGRPARSDRALRRDLQRDHLRGRARLDRDHARDGRAHDRPRRLLQDLRHDRLATRLRRDAGRLCRPDQQADGQQRLLHLGRCPARRDRGPRPDRRTMSARWSRPSGRGATSSSTG